MLCLEQLHAISDTFGKHLENGNKKKFVTLFQFGNSKKSPQYVLTHALLAYSQVCP